MLVSHLDEEDYSDALPMQDLFKSYRESHFMVNINSDLMPQIMVIQAFKNEKKIRDRAQPEFKRITRDYFVKETKMNMLE